jgi:PTH1 family peptidyl-tRNA hydrolase
MIELAAFLGNPGKEYARNRHNAGFLLAEKLPFYNTLSWQKKFLSLYSVLERSRLADFFPDSFSSVSGSRLHFIKPETFMNLSGKPVSQAASFFKFKSDSILVIHDELELPLGTLSLKFGGGLSGHNGLRSIKALLGTPDFWRVRIGIGRPDSRLPGEGGPPGSGEGIADWVLSNFEAAETEILDMVLETGTELFFRAILDEPACLLPEWAKKKHI